ncbi:MAG: dehydrogenase [Bacteroidetes bacterium HGW-Bacteroidetes-1]|jgi:pyruvate/2-oxoglutarate dehydrogenase complex dihydrolipoamide acyltransferase (E2) component|nr:MAG: dehydrogenase [Bacteroidetes bacterium HGW-Bacteroidetes-1]
MTNYKILKFPDSRIASIDICEIGKQKHHVTGLVEFDVTESRRKIKDYNKAHINKITFNAWLISVIGFTIKKHETSSSYLIGRNKQIIFDDINISMIVEKEINGMKVPIPLIIEKANEESVESIAKQITEAKNIELTEKDILIQRKAKKFEKMYYLLPKFLRRYFWRYLLKHPKLAYKRMGNVAFTSIGMMGKVNGWFIPISVHPICFGISSIVKKPAVVDDKIEIREILKMSILIDHDVIDGANMARLISDLSRNIEVGLYL